MKGIPTGSLRKAAEEITINNTNTSEVRRLNSFIITESIEKELETDDAVKDIFAKFFLNGKAYSDFEKEDLNPEMLQKLSEFELLFKFIFKRILADIVKRKPRDMLKLADFVDGKHPGSYEAKAQFLSELYYLIYHDLSHYFVTVIRGTQTDNSPTPKFLKTQTSFNDKESLEDEFFALIFDFQYASKVLHTSNDLNDFIKNYLDEAYITINKVNESEISKYCKANKIPESKNKLILAGLDIMENILRNPPSKLIEMLKYIWGHKDDPRVLVNLFFEVENIKKFILKLKAREKGLRKREERHKTEELNKIADN